MDLEDDGSIRVIVDDDPDDTVTTSPDGTIEVKLPDGGVSVKFGAAAVPEKADDPKKFYRNLADDIGDERLGQIAEELLEQIQADDNSRAQTLTNHANGLTLTGLQLEPPKSGVGDSASPSEGGMSVVTNPLMLDATLRSWANSSSELLPADGPCKIEDESDQETDAMDDLAEAYQRDMNYFLTTIASEYYPDTQHMLLWSTTFKGAGIKKVFVDPQLRRPSSQSVDLKDFIVSDTTKDLKSCQRLTHQITMRPSVLKRLQMRKYYRDIKMAPASAPQKNVVEQKIDDIQGTSPNNIDTRPEDMPFTLYETQCELNLPQYAPKEFGDREIALPFLVTIEKDSRTILALRRDWKPEDEDCTRKQMYVKYPYIPGPGFYGTGLLNVLGNSSAALTAAWRLCLDAGMAANFPGGVVAEMGGRQKTSTLRPSIFEFTPIQTNGKPIGDVLGQLPFHDLTPGLLGLIDKITEQCKAAGGAIEVPVKEGVKDIPVGTMLAYIEQAAQIMLAAHKGMHGAQSEELGLIADLFREEPESFWRMNKKRKGFWNEEKLFQALDAYNLVPKSDPNIPSHVHRILKATALIQLGEVPMFAGRLDPDEILRRVLRAMKEDPTGLQIKPAPQQPQPSPDMIKAQNDAKKADASMLKVQVDAAKVATEAQDRQAELAGEERVETLRLAQTSIAHAADNKKAAADTAHKAATHGLAVAQAVHDASMDHAEHALDVHQALNPPPMAPDVTGGGAEST